MLDLSPLNAFLRNVPFRMETPASLRIAMHPGDWATSIDLRDAYFHLLINQRDEKWLRFVWRDKIFQVRALPFGVAPAPWIFTKVTRELCLHARARGIRLRVYLDDWLVLASSPELCSRHSQQILHLCRSLGFSLNEEKSDLRPSQRFSDLRPSQRFEHGLRHPAMVSSPPPSPLPYPSSDTAPAVPPVFLTSQGLGNSTGVSITPGPDGVLRATGASGPPSQTQVSAPLQRSLVSSPSPHIPLGE